MRTPAPAGRRRPWFAVAVILAMPAGAAEPLADWTRSGALFVITTPDGADLPAGAVVERFPLLVRLHGDSFDFGAARPDGADLRFTTAAGVPLAHEVESWDAAAGTAAVWVCVPRIEGNAVQELRVHWGNPAAASTADGRAVFNAANGHLSVWHMADEVADSAGTLASRDTGTTPVAGVIGGARRLPGGKGVCGGTEIEGYPTGAAAHTTEAWFRAERSNVTVVAWGNEAARGKVMMNLRSPPHVSMDCYFSAGNVEGRGTLALGGWTHVVHTYREGDSRVYVDGVLDGVSPHAEPALAIARPARLWLGGWYDNYSFVGDLDEVRVSNVARSPEWVRLCHENQKPTQSLVGPVVPPGAEFGLSPDRLAIAEGATGTVTARAGGARKLTWVLERGGREQVLAVDRLSCTVAAGRVTGAETATLELRGVFADGVRSQRVAIAIADTIPEPEVTLEAPASWDGRTPVTVVPRLGNEAALAAAGAGSLRTSWSVSGPVVRGITAAGALELRRSLASGPLVVTLTADNGGPPATARATITVTEPARDPWIVPPAAPDDRPVDGRFYARGDDGQGTLRCNGRLDAPAERVTLRVFAGDEAVASAAAAPAADGTYALAARLPARRVAYRVECRAGDRLLHEARDILCGDVFLIAGQSNAVANDFGRDDPPPPSPWVRTFGATEGGPGARLEAWTTAVARAPGGKGEIGYWGVELGRRLADAHDVPICIINGAQGGTRIDQHQRDAADPESVGTIYGRLLWRVRAAGLAHGVRGILWHQGESDQGADGPGGGYGWETYRTAFHELAAAWQEDYPNLRHIHLFQIWPRACSMGRDGSDDRLREVQRTLPRDFSRAAVMSTLGIRPPGGCHYPAAGYAEFARLIAPLVERDHYGRTFAEPIAPPNLVRAAFTGADRAAIALEFDQPVVWLPAAAEEFRLDGRPGRVRAGSVQGNVLTLVLAEPGPVARISYVDGGSWNQDRVLRGTGGIAALTFCEVPVAP